MEERDEQTEEDPSAATSTDSPAPSKSASKWETLTSQALAQSWRLLVPTFGLTLIYINFHFLAKYVASSRYFSEFGQSLAFGRSNTTTQAASRMLGLKYWEIIAMIGLDFIALTAILFISMVIATYLWAITNRAEALLMIPKAIVDHWRAGVAP